MFKTLHDLNFYGRLIPKYIYSADRIEYRIEKYIDLDTGYHLSMLLHSVLGKQLFS